MFGAFDLVATSYKAFTYIGNSAIEISRLLGGAYTFGMGTIREDERLACENVSYSKLLQIMSGI